jgi:hypothetical protein
MDRQEEEWAEEELFEAKAHYLCERNGFIKPIPGHYTEPEKFIKDDVIYNERFKYYYSQLRAGKMQVL